MANKTRSDIRTAVLAYLPQMNMSSKTTMVNDLIDLVVERMTAGPYDFRCFRVYTPDTATLTAGSYYLDLSSFTTMGAASANFKDITEMRWLKTGTNYYGKIEFVQDEKWHNKYGYVDYASATRGKPSEYTRLADRILFNCPTDESITIRCWWKKFHGPFAGDSTAHSFSTKDNMLAYQTIIMGVLAEAKMSLTGLELLQNFKDADARHAALLSELIARDRDVANESTDVLKWAERSDLVDESDPYDWVS